MEDNIIPDSGVDGGVDPSVGSRCVFSGKVDAAFWLGEEFLECARLE